MLPVHQSRKLFKKYLYSICTIQYYLYSYRRATRSYVMRHFFTGNGTDQCQNGSSILVTPYCIESNFDGLVLLSPTHGQRSQQGSGQIMLQSLLISKPKFLKATGHAEIRKHCKTEVHGGGGLELMKPAREPASSRSKFCESPKTSLESCPFAAPCWPS